MGNTRRKHVIKCRNAVGSDKKQMIVIQLVNVAHFATGMQFQLGEVGL